MAIEYERITVVLKIGRSAVRPHPGYRVWDPTHHALGDRHAGYVSKETGGFTIGRVLGRRGRTMTATASIMAEVMGSWGHGVMGSWGHGVMPLSIS